VTPGDAGLETKVETGFPEQRSKWQSSLPADRYLVSNGPRQSAQQRLIRAAGALCLSAPAPYKNKLN